MQFLQQNVERHALDNVTIVREALGPRTGRSVFNMDSTLAAGLVDYLVYPDTGQKREVDTVTIEDFCKRIGRTPDFVKMDIEGAELAVIESSLEFLRSNPIHFAIDSEHKGEDGKYTSGKLEKLFQSLDYESFSSDKFDVMITWCLPRPGGDREVRAQRPEHGRRHSCVPAFDRGSSRVGVSTNGPYSP